PKVTATLANNLATEECHCHTILGNSPFAARARRRLVFEDWSAQKAHPAMLSAKQFELFTSQDKVCVEDIHAAGELLFARKLSDETLPLVGRLEEMIKRKEGVSRRAM